MTTFYLDHSWRQQAKSDRYYYNFLPARPWGLGQYLTEKERVLQARFFQTIRLISRCCSKPCFLDYHKNQNNMRPSCLLSYLIPHSIYSIKLEIFRVPPELLTDFSPPFSNLTAPPHSHLPPNTHTHKFLLSSQHSLTSDNSFNSCSNHLAP